MNSNHDDFSRAPVGGITLRPWWNLLTIELGVLISIPIFVIGGKLGFGLTLRDLILAAVLGGTILGVIGAPTARLGAVMRCSTAMIARSTFGSRGAAYIGVLLALGMTGWWGVQTELFAGAILKLTQTLFHLSISREFIVAVAGCAMITTAALGIRAIGRLAYLAVPLLLSGIAYGMYSLLSTPGWSNALTYEPAHDEIGLGPAIATVVGGWIVGASMNPDFARFAKNSKHAVGYALAHYSFNYPLLLIVCGIMAIGFQTKDLLIHLVPPHLTWLLLILMMLATWAANDCNLYSSSLGLTVVFPGMKRSALAIVAGLVGILFAEFRLGEHLVSFLVLLGILIAPISGVFIVGAVDPRNPNNHAEIGAVPKWRLPQLFAWLAGVLFGLLSTPKAELGLGLITLTTVPALDAVLVAGTAMLFIKLLQESQETPIDSGQADGHVKTVSEPRQELETARR